MSVQQNTYVIVGVVRPFKSFTEEQREAMDDYYDSAFKGIHHHNGLCAISDGMNGEYFAVGRVLSKSANCEGLPMTDCRIQNDLRNEVRDLLEQHLQISVSTMDVSVLAFTHYR